jgi:hypothetical protein
MAITNVNRRFSLDFGIAQKGIDNPKSIVSSFKLYKVYDRQHHSILTCPCIASI